MWESNLYCVYSVCEYMLLFIRNLSEEIVARYFSFLTPEQPADQQIIWNTLIDEVAYNEYDETDQWSVNIA